MPHIPIPLIPHLTDNEAGVVDAVECHYGPTQGVGIPPLHIEVQELGGFILSKMKSRHVMVEITRSILIFLSLSASFLYSLPSPISLLEYTSHCLIRTASPPPYPYRRSKNTLSPRPPLRPCAPSRPPAPPSPTARPRSFSIPPPPPEGVRSQVIRRKMESVSGFPRRLLWSI